jgi:hypothetical protein
VLTADILPGWSAAWIEIERERFRQLRLYAIEERSQRLHHAGRFDHAVAMAKVAVRTAPSRESARRALIEAYVAQGDLAAAVNAYDEYQELLRSSGRRTGRARAGRPLPHRPRVAVLRARSMMPRSAVQLHGGVRAVRSGRRLVAGGAAPGYPRWSRTSYGTSAAASPRTPPALPRLPGPRRSPRSPVLRDELLRERAVERGGQQRLDAPERDRRAVREPGRPAARPPRARRRRRPPSRRSRARPPSPRRAPRR